MKESCDYNLFTIKVNINSFVMKLILLLATLFVPVLALGDGAESTGSAQSVSSSSIDGPGQLRQSSGMSLLEGLAWTTDSERAVQPRQLKKQKKQKIVKTCSSTTDCASGGSEYCAKGVCLASGKCTTNADCFNPENTYPTVACNGEILCNKGRCLKTCTNCLPAPCAGPPCEMGIMSCSEEVANCANYFCGGCYFFAFDKAGNEVCKG